MLAVLIFIISRFPGIRFWHLFLPCVINTDKLVARVSLSLVSPPFLIKIKDPLMEGIFDL
jgi:hypothetical protein